MNRLKKLMTSNAASMETPDDQVSQMRLAGREAFRVGERYQFSRELPVAEGHRVEFWSGYLDAQIAVKLGHLFGLGVKPS